MQNPAVTHCVKHNECRRASTTRASIRMILLEYTPFRSPRKGRFGEFVEFFYRYTGVYGGLDTLTPRPITGIHAFVALER